MLECRGRVTGFPSRRGYIRMHESGWFSGKKTLQVRQRLIQSAQLLFGQGDTASKPHFVVVVKPAAFGQSSLGRFQTLLPSSEASQRTATDGVVVFSKRRELPWVSFVIYSAFSRLDWKQRRI